MIRRRDGWSEAENDILRDFYAKGAPMVDILCKLKGRTANAAWKQACLMGLSRPKGFRLGQCDSEPTLRALALAARPQGVNRVDIGGRSQDGELLNRLARKKRLHRGILGHRTVHFFTTETAAHRWQAANIAGHVAKQAFHGGKAPRKPHWDASVPIYYPVAPDVTPLYKITIAPPPPKVLYRTNTYSR